MFPLKNLPHALHAGATASNWDIAARRSKHQFFPAAYRHTKHIVAGFRQELRSRHLPKARWRESDGYGGWRIIPTNPNLFNPFHKKPPACAPRRRLANSNIF